MRSTYRSAILAAIAGTAQASITLSDFDPKLSNLPSSCQKLYTTNIVRCQASDFGGNGCTQSCIDGLTAIGGPIQAACANAGISGSNVLSSFLNGVGVTNLCPNAQVTQSSVQQQTSTQPSATSSTDSPSTSQAQSTSSTDQPTSSPSSTPSTSTTSNTPSTTSPSTTSSTSAGSSTDGSGAATSSSSSSSLTGTSSSSSSSSSAAGHTSSTTGFVYAPTTSGAASNVIVTASSSPGAPTSTSYVGSGSGGGSPFDSPGGQGSAASTLSCSVVLTIMTVITASLLMR